MAFHVIQCPKCSRRLHAVPAATWDALCPDCGLRAPVEAFRWVASDVARPQAERILGEWNPRLARGLTVAEAREFAELAA